MPRQLRTTAQMTALADAKTAADEAQMTALADAKTAADDSAG